jgi:hypothetical protein
MTYVEPYQARRILSAKHRQSIKRRILVYSDDTTLSQRRRRQPRLRLFALTAARKTLVFANRCLNSPLGASISVPSTTMSRDYLDATLYELLENGLNAPD